MEHNPYTQYLGYSRLLDLAHGLASDLILKMINMMHCVVEWSRLGDNVAPGCMS